MKETGEDEASSLSPEPLVLLTSLEDSGVSGSPRRCQGCPWAGGLGKRPPSTGSADSRSRRAVRASPREISSAGPRKLPHKHLPRLCPQYSKQRRREGQLPARGIWGITCQTQGRSPPPPAHIMDARQAPGYEFHWKLLCSPVTPRPFPDWSSREPSAHPSLPQELGGPTRTWLLEGAPACSRLHACLYATLCVSQTE